MDDTIRRTPAGSRARWWLAGALLVVSGAGVVCATAGWTIWVLAIAAALAVASAIAPFAGWMLGFAGGIIVPLGIEVFVVRLPHRLGLTLEAADVLVLVAIGVAGAVVVVLAGDRVRVPGRPAWWGAAAAAVVPLIMGVVFAVLPALRNGTALSWAMRNDAVWNLVSARYVVTDRGFIPSLHPNSSPLTAMLLATGLAPGRDATPAGHLLSHDIVAMATFLALSTVFTALVAGIVVADAVPAAHPVYRALGAVVGSALVCGWFVAGFSFQFGFYNVLPTVAVLLASWLCWRRARSAPVAAVALLLVAATVLLALWAFLAAVPLALAVVAGVREILVRARSYGPVAWILLGLAALQLLAYALLFSLPDLRRDQGALAQGGSMAPVTPALLFILLGLTLAVTAAASAVPFPPAAGEDRAPGAGARDLAGVVTAGVALVAVYLYLGTQVQPNAYGWGYYPAKLVWLGAIVLLQIFLGSALGLLARLPLAPWPRVAAAAGAVVTAVALAAGVMPPSPTIGSLVPAVDLLGGTGVASGDAVLPTLFALDDPAQKKTMLVDYFDWRADGFANLWLLGASATTTGDPIRSFSYYLNTQDLHAVCQALGVWRGDVTIRTRSSTLGSQLAAACPAEHPMIVVGAIGAP